MANPLSASQMDAKLSGGSTDLSQADKDLSKMTKQANSAAKEGLLQPDFSAELGALDLSAIIGGPLRAAIIGMTHASTQTLKFIKDVCFNPGKDGGLGEPVMVEFELEQPGSMMGMIKNKFKLQIPFMTMVNIPHLRLQKVRVEFNVHLTSTRTANLSSTNTKNVVSIESTSKTVNKESGTYSTEQTYNTQRKDNTDAEGNTVSSNPFYWETSVSNTENPLNVDKTDWTQTATSIGKVSSQHNNTAGGSVTKDYSLQVVVTAVQDELPRGIEKLLDILESQIGQVPEDPIGKALMDKMAQGISQGIGGGASAGASAGGSTAGGSTASASTGTQ